jgi:hypothetical protein
MSDLEDLVRLGTPAALAKRQIQAFTMQTPASMVVGNPTGGNMGPGTINVEKLFIEGQAPGQYASRVVPSANALPLTNGVTLNISSVVLPAGQWDLMAEVWIAVTSGTPNIQAISAALSNVNATIPSDPSDLTAVNFEEPQQPRTGGGTGAVLPIAGPWITTTTPTTYYLCARVSWTGTGTLTAFGMMGGRFFPTGG